MQDRGGVGLYLQQKANRKSYMCCNFTKNRMAPFLVTLSDPEGYFAYCIPFNSFKQAFRLVSAGHARSVFDSQVSCLIMFVAFLF